MEILKNVVLALHIIGVVGLLGGVIYQASAMREGKARVIPTMIHSAWTMLITAIALVGMQYALGAAVLLINVVAYAALWRRYRRHPR